MSTTAPITFSGIATGIDSSSIITALVSAEQKPITQLQDQEGTYQAELSDWQSYNTGLTSLQGSVAALSDASTFTATSGASSNSSVASITTQAGAQVGNHSLTVTQLAQAQKVVSNSVASSSASLGETGSFTLNGKTITVNSTTSLADLASAINSSGAGVTANVVNVGTGDYRLILSGNNTGTANALSASDNGSGTVLANLGLLSGTASIRDAVTPSATQAGAGSIGLSSATQSVANALGAASGSAASGTVQINGVSVAINLNTDSLNTIASNINAAGIPGITAQVVALPDSSGNVSASSPQQLEILSSNTTTSNGTTTVVPPTFTDSGNILSTLGITQSGFTSTITQAQDAEFNLDGLAMTRASNTFGDAISGASVSLLSAGSQATPATTTLSVTQNTSAIVQSVQSFVDAYNAVESFYTQENTFTAPTSGSASGTQGTSPSLFGDTTLSDIQQHLSKALNGVSGSTTLASIGLTIGSTGQLALNTTTLTNALQSNSTQVAGLFGLTGQANNSNVQFVAANASTVSSTGTGYAVNITQAATQSNVTAQQAQTGASAAPETLTFSGALFGQTSTAITLPTGNTLQDTVNQINASSSLNGSVYASINAATGALEISSLNYGSGTGFSVSSSLTSGGSGIGAGTTATAGVNVAGTIGGQPATGSGRTLTANSGNSTTEGISLLVSATTSGAYGNVSITHGVADALGNALTSILDPTKGSLITAENSLNSQISSAQNQITQIQTQVTAYQQYLTQMFATMESQVAALQQQGAAFAAQTGTTAPSSSSGTANTKSSTSSSG